MSGYKDLPNSSKIAVWSAGVSAATSITASIFAFHDANKAKIEANNLKIDLTNAENNRQAIVNPYAGMSNPFANLGVATKAAEFQAEQADIALANTLDAVRQSGAGGATALAQAALKSKQGISADIQKQELDNSRLRAKGEMAVQKIVAEGEKFKWQAQENREMQRLNRLQAQYDNQQAMRMSYRAAGMGALTDMAQNITNLAGVMAGQEQDAVSTQDATSFNQEDYNTYLVNQTAQSSADRRLDIHRILDTPSPIVASVDYDQMSNIQD